MCGISGIYKNSGGGLNELKKNIEKMNARQKRRGPDGDGIFIDEKNGLAFGHNRLSIIDLSDAGKQPMSYGDAMIVFNGEIYNFLDLKNDLEKIGYKFKTQTDTEVILALYAEYGEKSFGMLRGMFAFAIWDSKRKKIFLVRDRYGIKPIYYYADGGKLVFASTVKAMIESNEVPVIKNSRAYIGFLLFGSVPLPMTTIENVFALPAGHYLEFDAGIGYRLVKYYDFLSPFQNKKNIDFESASREINSLMDDSIVYHMISDAPLGVFLSGGLDSSAIAAFARRSLGEGGLPLTTLSVIFDEPEFSEQKYQRLVAQKFNSDHREVKITKNDFFNSFGEIFDAMDQPTIDGVNTFFIAQAAKKAGLKAVLSGLGADEIFCGYPSFKRADTLRSIQNLPKFLKLPLNLTSLVGGRYRKLKYLGNNDILSFYLSNRGLFMPYEIAEILGSDLKEVNNFLHEFLISQLASQEINKLHPVDLLSYLEIKFYLQNQLLKDTDFMSMYHSIEVRVPFLDHNLVEYLSSLSSELKVRGEINKQLLVKAVRDLLPEEIFSRPKMGFTFPFQKWLSVDGGHWSRHWAREVLKKFR